VSQRLPQHAGFIHQVFRIFHANDLRIEIQKC
jgi:hypothetical protein